MPWKFEVNLILRIKKTKNVSYIKMHMRMLHRNCYISTEISVYVHDETEKSDKNYTNCIWNPTTGKTINGQNEIVLRVENNFVTQKARKSGPHN